MLFFFVFFFQLIIMIFQTIGLNGECVASCFIDCTVLTVHFQDGGTVGVFTAIQLFDGTVGGVFLGIFCLMIAIGFGLAAGGTALLLTKVCTT